MEAPDSGASIEAEWHMLYFPCFKGNSSLAEYTTMRNVIRHQDAVGTV